MHAKTPYYNTVQTVHNALSAAFTRVATWWETPEALRLYKPLNNGWTIDEILEHITLTNHFLLIIIRKGCAKALRRKRTHHIGEGESNLQQLSVVADTLALHWEHPTHMTPTGTVPLAQVQARMDEQQQECGALLDSISQGEGVLHTVRMSVAELGKIDMYQWLFFLAQHIQRHCEQMEKNKREYEEIALQHGIQKT